MGHTIVGSAGDGTGYVASTNQIDTVSALTIDGVSYFNSIIVNDTDGVLHCDHTFDPTAAGDNVVTSHVVPAKSYIIIDNGQAGTVAISNVHNTHGTGAQYNEAIYVAALI